MSTQTKFYKLLMGLMLCSTVTFAQLNYQHKLLEFVWTPSLLPGLPPIGGFNNGPTTANQVVTFARDTIDNNKFVLQGTGTNPVSPALTATFSLPVQNYTGFTYGTGSPYPISTGLVFGAEPSTAFGLPPQQVGPLDSYRLLGAFGGGGGPRNGMFQSDCSNPAPGNFPGASGTGIDAEASYPTGAIDANGAVEVFTAAQRMFDLNNAAGTANRYYYGDLLIQFKKTDGTPMYVDSPVVHIAGLGGSYRYFVAGGNSLIAGDWRQTFFSTELELVAPNYVTPTLTKMAGNQFLAVSGNNITNNATTPNGESIDVGAVALPNWNNFGAATGSVRVSFIRAGQPAPTNFLRFKIWLRGCDANNVGTGFRWSALGSASGGTRDPLTGDVWYVSVTTKSATSTPICGVACLSLPANGVNLTAALNGSDVSLNWKTQSETNSNYFVIERSTDGINFSSIGNKQAAGNSAVELSYNYIDPNMVVPAYFYRLKLVDVDGHYTYSNTAIVRKAGSIKAVKVFPNPVKDQMNIEFDNAKGNYEISIYNQMGQKVINQNAVITSTVQYVNISKGSLAPGSYLVSTRNTETNEKYTQNVIFQ